MESCAAQPSVEEGDGIRDADAVVDDSGAETDEADLFTAGVAPTVGVISLTGDNVACSS